MQQQVYRRRLQQGTHARFGRAPRNPRGQQAGLLLHQHRSAVFRQFQYRGGAWNNLEAFVDAQVCADTTYIVVGTYFKPFTDAYGQSCSPAKISFGGRNDVTRPSMFYYLILRTKSGSTRKSVRDCRADELKCAAFVLRHNMEKGHKPQAKDMMKVSDLEALTGFQFFANVPNAPKSSYNPSDWGL